MSTLGKILKEKRKKIGASQAEVAKKLGYSSPQFISNWERGLSAPPVTSLRTLASLYKISPENLFQIYLKTTLKMVETDIRRKFSKRRAN
ncbi:MAG: helix-turn-helix transcriptional regulator [Bdellovibrionota bacterium]